MYSILESLFELSEKADRIIERAFSNNDLDEKFLYAKNTMQQIINGDFPKYGLSPHAKIKTNVKRFKLRNSDGIRLQNKSQIFVKKSLSPIIQNAKSSDSGVIFVSSPDTEDNVTLMHENNGQEFHQSEEACKSHKSSVGKSENIVTRTYNDVNSAVSNNKICSPQHSFETAVRNETTLNSNVQIPVDDETDKKGKETKIFTPQNDKISFDFENMLHKKRRTRSVTKHFCKMGIPLDGSFHKQDDTLDNTSIADKICEVNSTSSKKYEEGILNKTYVINSTTNEENEEKNDEDVLNRTYVISSTSSGEYNDCTLILRNSSTDTEITTTADVLNINRKRKLGKDHNESMSTNILNVEEKGIPDESLTSVVGKSSSTTESKNRNEENLSDKIDFNSNNTLEVISLLSKCDKIEILSDRKNAIQEQNDKKASSYLEKICPKANPISLEKNVVTDSSSCNKSARQSVNKYPIPSLNFNRREIFCNSSADGSTSEFKKITQPRKTNTNKFCERHFQTNSAPVNRKQFKRRLYRPATPVEFISDYKRQSLKDEAEEKRKRREIRVQKAKERRERLQRKKEEKNKLNEQRLKERLEQHEKMLRQKVNKFRRKLRNQQHWNTREYHSSTSTSSKDSKEGRVTDNDVCRNVLENVQQLSKVDNSYHDMSLKKAAPNSLLGNVGQNPRTPKKHNSVVSCQKTPVALSTYVGVTDSQKAKLRPAYIQDSKGSKYIESPDSSERFLKNTSVIHTALCHIQEIDSLEPNQEESKRNSNQLNKTDSEIYELQLNENSKLSTGKISSEGNRKKSPYFLRSAQKTYTNNTLTASVEEELQNSGDEKSYETISSENGNCGCSYSCFSCSKSKKNMGKLYGRVLARSRISGQLRKKKRCLTDSNEGIAKKKVCKKALKKNMNVTSYKISDMHERSFDEAEVDHSKIPLWATGLYLKQALIQQYYKPPNVEKIFGIIPDEPIDLTSIFEIDKPEYHRRTSSEKWSATDTPS